MKIEELIRDNSAIVENELEKYSDINGYGIEKAMRYSLLSGGKRIRPFIAIETYRMFSGEKNIEKVLPFACALEMIHTYSLIHDDMPCIDNDDYRRGKLTNHKVFGEAEALLAGDALLTYAFKVASENKYVSDKSICLAIKTLSNYAGYAGMIGGQEIDIKSGENIRSYKELQKMDNLKTGALIRCAVLLGYYAFTDVCDDIVISDLTMFADNIGIAFQLRDDVLDRIADEKTLGKPIGSDEKNQKITALSFMTVENAQSEIERLSKEAIKIINKYYKDENSPLSEFVKYLVNRIK